MWQHSAKSKDSILNASTRKLKNVGHPHATNRGIGFSSVLHIRTTSTGEKILYELIQRRSRSSTDIRKSFSKNESPIRIIAQGVSSSRNFTGEKRSSNTG